MTATIDQKEKKRLMTIDFFFCGSLWGCFVGLYMIHGEQVVAAFST